MDDERDEQALARWEQRTDLPLTALSVGYLVVYAVQVLATRPGRPLWTTLDAALWGVWAVFVLDYVVRLALARRRGRFVVRHPVDLLVALAPFFRFLRLLRLLSAVSTLGRTMRDDLRGRVGTYLVVSVSLLSFVAALGVYDSERDAPDASITTFGDALWWVLTTITTVGYGDRYPVTIEGRFVAAGLMLAGIAVLGTVTAAIASWFLEQVGASDPTEALPGRRAAGPGEREPGDGAVDARAATSDEVAELVTELRAVRRRLEALEGGR